MIINEKLKEIMQALDIPYAEGMSYLIDCYFDTVTRYTPSELKKQIDESGIFDINGSKVLKWNIPLFQGQEVKFNWVETEYLPIFPSFIVGKTKYLRESLARMKKLFAENPELRKEEVIEATKLYMQNQTNTKFIRLPHYFIQKGVGVAKIQDILTWVDAYRGAIATNTAERTSLQNKRQ